MIALFSSHKKSVIGMISACLSLLISTSAVANPIIPVSASPTTLNFSPTSPNLEAKGFILIDATTGKVLAENNANTRLAPASLTKLMSLYVISNAIKTGAIKWEDQVTISSKAWKAEGSRMFVKVGDKVPVKDLIQGVIVASGNDATIALAEHIAGTEEAFVNLMNQQAQALGMKSSHFMDSTGLPNANHYSTPTDLARLAQRYIQDFPEHYALYSQKWFAYNGIRQPNRNRLLWRYEFADGLKTGHTDEAGYCLVASAKKNGMRLISVVMGDPSDNARTEDSVKLLTYGFRFYETRKLYNANTPVAIARVWQGVEKETRFGFPQDLYATLQNNQFNQLKTEIVMNQPLKAPITKGKAYGELQLKSNNEILLRLPLLALSDNPTGGFIQRGSDELRYKFHKWFGKSQEKVDNS